MNDSGKSVGLVPIVAVVSFLFAAGLTVAYWLNASDLRMLIH